MFSRNAYNSWWRHQMEAFSALLAICAGNPVNSPHKGQWRGALMFSVICVWINGWVNNREARDLRPYRAHYDVIVMLVTNSNSNIYANGLNVISSSGYSVMRLTLICDNLKKLTPSFTDGIIYCLNWMISIPHSCSVFVPCDPNDLFI